MLKSALSIFVVAAALIAADPEGWFDARWGMTQEQVRNSVKMATVPTGPIEQRSFAGEIATVSIPQLQLGRITSETKKDLIVATVLFFLEEREGLSAVRLRIHDPDEQRFDGLRQALEKKYGPATLAKARFSRWSFPTTVITLSLRQPAGRRPVGLWLRYESVRQE
jgi:hypothetical protein